MKRLMYLFLLLTLLLVACGGGDEPAAEVEEVPAAVPAETAVAETPETAAVEEAETAVPTVESAAEDSDSAAEPATVEPATTDAETTDSDTTSANASAEPPTDEESSSSEETSTENSENDGEGEETAENTTAGDGDAACLVGSWRVTNFDDYFAAVVQDAMAGSGQTMEITSTSSGDLLLSFDGTNMTMSDNNFQVIVTVAGQTVPVDIEAAGSATYTVEDGVLSGEIDSVNVDDTNTGLGYGVSNIVGQPVSFSCEGDSLSWLDQSGYTVMLSRVN
ncbi:MAG: hypothetical protein KDE51_14670 [Anaerolineales bacterium]|nr:hypothetical protein [Anaerolineales bacterium]